VLAALVRMDADLRAAAAGALQALLERHGGRVTPAAAALGLSEGRALLAAVAALGLGEWLSARWPDRSKGGRPRKREDRREPEATPAPEPPKEAISAAGEPEPPAPPPPPTLDYVDARPGTAKVGFLKRWTPRHVWTLHRVPGRLGEVLAVRRRVLEEGDGMLRIEIARTGAWVGEDLQAHGRDRSTGRYRGKYGEGPGCEVSLWAYDHNPTAEERATWMRERLLEQELVKAPPRRVWVALPGVAPGQPDRAVSVKAKRSLGRTYGDMCTRGDLQVDVVALGIDTAFDSVDLYALARGEAVTLEWHVGGEHQEARVLLEKPSRDLLAQLGAERARKVAEEARDRAQAEAFWNSVRSKKGGTPAAEQQPTDALSALGLDEDATADDVRRAFRRKVSAERCHPDQGGDRIRFQELTALQDAALRAIGVM